MGHHKTETDAEAAGKEQNEADGKQVGFKIFKYADTTDKVLLSIGATTALLSGVGMPAYSQIQGKIIGKLSSTDEDIYSTMCTLALALVITGGVIMVLQGVRCYCVSFSSMRQTTRIKYFYFQALLRQEVAWHDQHPPGELTSRMDGDIRVIERALGENIMLSLQHLGTIGFGFGVAFYNGWELALFMLGAMPFIAIVSALMGRVMLKASTQTRDGYSKAGAIALEAIDNVKTVQIFGREDFETDRFAKAVAPTVPAGIRKEFATYVTTGVNDFILYVVYGMGFWYGAYLIRWGRIDISEFITIFFANASNAIGRFSPCLSTFLEGAGAAGKIFAVIDRVPAMDSITKAGSLSASSDPTTDESIKIVSGEPVMDGPRPIGLSLPDGKFQNAINFKDVSFSYPTRLDEKLFTKFNLLLSIKDKQLPSQELAAAERAPLLV